MIIGSNRMPEHPYFSCSPAFKGVILEGMEEVIGAGGLDEMLNMSGLSALKEACLSEDECTQISYSDLSLAQKNLEMIYGRYGGRGLALIAGRNYFTYSIRKYGKSLGLLDLDFRLLPLKVKLQTGLNRMARHISQASKSRIYLEENADQYRWIVERCPLCWHRHSDMPICDMQVGMLQQFTYWASGGKIYSVSETECIAMGAEACVFSIDKVAIE